MLKIPWIIFATQNDPTSDKPPLMRDVDEKINVEQEVCWF